MNQLEIDQLSSQGALGALCVIGLGRNKMPNLDCRRFPDASLTSLIKGAG
jgi:hypothetical protein